MPNPFPAFINISKSVSESNDKIITRFFLSLFIDLIMNIVQVLLAVGLGEANEQW